MVKPLKNAFLWFLFILIGLAQPVYATVSEEYKASVRSTLAEQIQRNADAIKKSYHTTGQSYFHSQGHPLEIDTLGSSAGEVVGA